MILFSRIFHVCESPSLVGDVGTKISVERLQIFSVAISNFEIQLHY